MAVNAPSPRVQPEDKGAFTAYSQVCLLGGGREQDGGRDEGREEGEDSHYTNDMHTVIREYGSTLYVGLSRFPHRANTNHFCCNLLAGEFLHTK